MSYEIQAATPTQCVSQTLTWRGPAEVTKGIGVWVQDTDYFAEFVRDNLTNTLGTLDWVCDFPAGAWIGFQIYNLPSAKDYATRAFLQVQPGTTDECLRQNPGQMATASMAALASSLSSASPQLFTYASTALPSTTSSTASPTITSAGFQTPSSTPNPPNDSNGSTNVGAIVGGAVGGVAALAVIAVLLFLLCRRKSRSSSSASPSEKTYSPGPGPTSPSNGGAGGFFRAMSTNPVDAWRRHVSVGKAPSVAPTRRSRTTSFATQAVTPTMPYAAGSTAPPPLPRSQGPREGVPEIGEGTDYRAYGNLGAVGGLGAVSHGPQPRSGAFAPFNPPPALGAYAPVALSDQRQQRTPSAGLPELGGYDLELPVRAEQVVRPPTRLSTPGGMTTYGGDGVEVVRGGGAGLGAGGVGYASCSRAQV
ncbi:uncharacterized protein JCM10292_002280 [Rhodotorula paludigena]|uniref:uncharacterized protein n=1 Tax=Rhodotorula paludigena TaxID=86838 RepID=UPI00318206DA